MCKSSLLKVCAGILTVLVVNIPAPVDLIRSPFGISTLICVGWGSGVKLVCALFASASRKYVSEAPLSRHIGFDAVSSCVVLFCALDSVGLQM